MGMKLMTLIPKKFKIRKIKDTDLIEFWSYLAHLTGSQIPLVQALGIIENLTRSSLLKKIIHGIILFLHEGKLLSDALEKYPSDFSPSTIQLVRLAEHTGTYSKIFQRLEEQGKWALEVKQLVRQSLRYPLILLGVLSIFIAVLIIWVIPSFKSYLGMLPQKELPILTTLLIFMGDHMKAMGFFFIFFILAGIGIIVMRRHLNRKPLRYTIPRLGNLLYRLETLNFGHHFGVLLKARIDVLTALFHAAQTVNCPWLQNKLLQQESFLIQGLSLSQTLPETLGKKVGVSSMIIAGEKSGNLADLLIKSTQFELNQTQRQLKIFLELLQPLLVIFMGILLAWVMLAILLPIYDSFELAGAAYV